VVITMPLAVEESVEICEPFAQLCATIDRFVQCPCILELGGRSPFMQRFNWLRLTAVDPQQLRRSLKCRVAESDAVNGAPTKAVGRAMTRVGTACVAAIAHLLRHRLSAADGTSASAVVVVRDTATDAQVDARQAPAATANAGESTRRAAMTDRIVP